MLENVRTGSVLVFAVTVITGIGSALHGSEFSPEWSEMQQAAEISSALSCPASASYLKPPATIAVRWSSALDAGSVRILTQDQSVNGRLQEIAELIEHSLVFPAEENRQAWSPDFRARITRVATPSACGIDGMNSICFDEADKAFTPGVLAVSRVITVDRAGIALRDGMVSEQPGQVLDVDIYFNPSNSPRAFATPAALAQNAKAYDLETILIHERKNFFLASVVPGNGGEMIPSCSTVATTLSDAGRSSRPPRWQSHTLPPR